MILRRQPFSLATFLPLYLLICFLPSSVADDQAEFKCLFNIGPLKYDLTSLTEHTVSRTRDTPPTSMVDSVRIDLCHDLKILDGVDAKDQVRRATR